MKQETLCIFIWMSVLILQARASTGEGIIEEISEIIFGREVENPEEAVRGVVSDYFTNACDDPTFPRYFTEDARVNMGGVSYVGRTTLEQLELAAQEVGATCKVEKFEIQKVQVQGDSAVVLVKETEVTTVPGDEPHTFEAGGASMTIGDERATNLVACELVKQNDKWLFSAMLFIPDEENQN